MQIHELQLECGDPRGTKRFYQEVLGMQVLNEDAGGLVIGAGQSILQFKTCRTGKPFYHFAFTIPSNQFDEAHQWVSNRVKLLAVTEGSTIAEFTNWNARSFYCYDNNGNILEYIARFDLPFESDQPFTCASVVSISEIGIVTGNVMQYCQAVSDKYGIGFFSRQQPQPDFAVMGDDEGLLIIVEEGRAWYPNATRAGRFNSKIVLDDRGRMIEINTDDEKDG